MVLHGEGRQVQGAQPLHDAVVEADVADLDAPVAPVVVGRHRGGVHRGVHREAVVVGGDLHPPGGPVEDRLVDAAVAVGQLVGPVPQGPPQELVAQADPEEGDALVQDPAQQLDLVHRRPGVPGAVGEEDPVGVHGQDVGQGGGLGQDVDAHAALGHLPGGAVLDPQVDGRHGGHRLPAGEGAGGLHDVGPGRGDLGGQGRPGHGRGGAHQVQAHVQGRPRGAAGVRGPGGQGRPGEDPGAHGAALAQVAGQGPGVHLAQAHHALGVQLVLQLAAGAPARGPAGGVAHHEAGHPDTAGLGVLVVDPGVADVGGGHDHDLAVVGGVGEGLLVAGHAGVEHDLANGAARGTVGAADQYVAVLQDQQGRAAAAHASSRATGSPARTVGRPCRKVATTCPGSSMPA